MRHKEIKPTSPILYKKEDGPSRKWASISCSLGLYLNHKNMLPPDHSDTSCSSPYFPEIDALYKWNILSNSVNYFPCRKFAIYLVVICERLSSLIQALHFCLSCQFLHTLPSSYLALDSLGISHSEYEQVIAMGSVGVGRGLHAKVNLDLSLKDKIRGFKKRRKKRKKEKKREKKKENKWEGRLREFSRKLVNPLIPGGQRHPDWIISLLSVSSWWLVFWKSHFKTQKAGS